MGNIWSIYLSRREASEMAQRIHRCHEGHGHQGAVVEPKSLWKPDAMGLLLHSKRCKRPFPQSHDTVSVLEALHAIAHLANYTYCLAPEVKVVAG